MMISLFCRQKYKLFCRTDVFLNIFCYFCPQTKNEYYLNMRQQRLEHASHKSRQQTTQQMVSYALIIGCFMLWGFTNDMTGAMVNAFSKIFRLNVFEGGLVNVANYFGYFVMAMPAALFIRRFKFKAGVLLGLGVYALGSLLFFPSKMTGAFSAFLSSYFIMTCGLAFLETSCHPFVYSMGPEESGIVRLNLAQAFNALGATIGMFVAHDYVQGGMSPLSSEERMNLPLAQFNIIKEHDLSVLIQPYLIISAFIILLIVAIRLRRMTTQDDKVEHKDFKAELREIPVGVLAIGEALMIKRASESSAAEVNS